MNNKKLGAVDYLIIALFIFGIVSIIGVFGIELVKTINKPHYCKAPGCKNEVSRSNELCYDHTPEQMKKKAQEQREKQEREKAWQELMTPEKKKSSNRNYNNSRRPDDRMPDCDDYDSYDDFMDDWDGTILHLFARTSWITMFPNRTICSFNTAKIISI